MMNNQRLSGWSLRKGLLISFGLSILFVFVFTQVIIIFGVPYTSFKGLLDIQIEKAFSDISELADSSKRQLEKWIFERQANLKTIAENPMLFLSVQKILQKSPATSAEEAALTLKQLREYLNLFKDSYYGEYSKIEIIEASSGKILLSTRPEEEGEDASQLSYFRKLLNPVVMEVVEKQMDSGGEISNLIFARGIRSSAKGSIPVIHAVLAIHNSMNNIQSILHEGIGKTGEIVLLDQDLRLQTPLRYPLADGSVPEPLVFVLSTKPASLAAQGIETIIKAQDYRGLEVIAATRHIRINTELAWGLVVKIDAGEVFQPIRQTLLVHALALTGALFFIGFLIMLIATRLTRPLSKLSQAAVAITEGDFSVRITPVGSRELQNLSRSFNIMVARLENWNNDLSAAVENRTVELAAANASLRESEERYRRIVETSSEGICTIDAENRTTFVNPRMAGMLGYQLQEMLGRPIASFMADEEQALHHEQMALRKKGISARYERRFKCRDGSLLWTLVSATPIQDDQGMYAGSLAMITDITERKRAEEERKKLQEHLLQAQKMESVGRLAGGVAHDFNNMLMAIIGNAELAMEKTDASTSIYDHLQEIHKSAQRSADLTRQLLAFARKQTINPKILNLNELVSGMLKMLQRIIGEQIDLVWKPSIKPWPVKLDPSQIDQILVNLAVNGRDAIAGVGTLTVETENVVFDETYCMTHAGFVPGEYVLLAVSDTGCGMKKETIQHLFEPFFTTKEMGKGTGLGLAMIYGIVKQNNGFINIYSEQGQGTTFKIYLPRTQPEGVTEAKEIQQKPARGTETVLLVEDELFILKLGKEILERYGYTVLDAQTPGEALKLAKNHKGTIHLLITDVIMPQMNGRDLMERIADLRPAIKTLYMSGYTSNVIVHHGVLDKNVQFIQKPFSVQTLASKVREVLGK